MHATLYLNCWYYLARNSLIQLAYPFRRHVSTFPSDLIRAHLDSACKDTKPFNSQRLEIEIRLCSSYPLNLFSRINIIANTNNIHQPTISSLKACNNNSAAGHSGLFNTVIKSCNVLSKMPRYSAIE